MYTIQQVKHGDVSDKNRKMQITWRTKSDCYVTSGTKIKGCQVDKGLTIEPHFSLFNLCSVTYCTLYSPKLCVNTAEWKYIVFYICLLHHEDEVVIQSHAKCNPSQINSSIIRIKYWFYNCDTIGHINKVTQSNYNFSSVHVGSE